MSVHMEVGGQVVGVCSLIPRGSLQQVTFPAEPSHQSTIQCLIGDLNEEMETTVWVQGRGVGASVWA